jgi:hypothetical protein
MSRSLYIINEIKSENQISESFDVEKMLSTLNPFHKKLNSFQIDSKNKK